MRVLVTGGEGFAASIEAGSMVRPEASFRTSTAWAGGARP